MYIFRAWITTKDGTKIYAKTYGKRAFRIWVGPGPEPEKGNQLVQRGIFYQLNMLLFFNNQFRKGDL